MVADPFTLLQCCPTGDGAAAIILASNKVSWRIRGDAIDVVASHLTSGRFMTGFRDMTSPEITVRGAKEAFEEAGVGPQDINVAEVHDAFSIAELLYYEAFGFCPRGEGAAMLEFGATSLGGRIPVNPSGGLLAKGHPVGATGAAQIVEIVAPIVGTSGSASGRRCQGRTDARDRRRHFRLRSRRLLDPYFPTMTDDKDRPLSGIRVLDLTQFLSGPYATQILADLGADIIKLEPPQGDPIRVVPPHFVGQDSVYYLCINRNKRCVAVDMKVPEGRELVKKLALAADIVMENFRPGVLERLGLSAEALRKEKPSLIWCSISGFGQDGPYRNKPAYDMIVQALSGGMSLTGESGGAPVQGRNSDRRSRRGAVFGDCGAGRVEPAARDRRRRHHRHLDARLPGRDAVLPGGVLHAFGHGAGPAGPRTRIDSDLSLASKRRMASISSSPPTPSACGRVWRARSAMRNC